MSTDATVAPATRRRSALVRLVKRMTGGPHRLHTAAAVTCSVIAVIGLIVIPYATGRGMNVIAGGGSREDLTYWVLIGLAGGAVYLGFSFIADRMFSRLAAKALYGVQTDLFDNVQTLSMGFFFKNTPGELSSNVTNDAEVISLFYTTALSQILRANIQVVMIVGVMLVLNWQLALVAIVAIPLLVGVAYVIAQISGPAFNKLQETLGDVSAFQEETLSGYKVIISNNRGRWAAARHEQHVDGVYTVGRRAFMASLLQFPITQAVSFIQNVLVLVAGTFLVIEGATTLGTVLALAGYAALLSAPLAEMANLITTSLNASAGGDRVFRLIDERPDIEDAPDAVDYVFKGGRIQFEDVDFGYVPHSLILRGNTFDVAPGENIGICGPTGAGKSTLINILTRYYDITAGRILVDGQDLSKLTQASLRKQIGVVLQEAFLFTDTVMNNLLYASEDATEEDAIEAAKNANAHDFILGLPNGYDTMLAARGANLSQGQRQMITIARAMVANPKMMILDEATSNVDTRTEKLIQNGMRKLMANKTSFSIAHRLATIRDSSRIMVLDGGEIVEMASHDELMAAKGSYYALYMSQFKGKGPGGDSAAGATRFVST